MALQDYNPFAKREQFTRTNLIAYKILTAVSWLLVIITGAYYTFNAPDDCKKHQHCHSIWDQNAHKRTPFALNSAITSIYWIVTLILQANYLKYLYSSDAAFVNAAGNVGSHFIVHNLLTFGFIMLWVRAHFWPGEILLIVNMLNLTMLYFRNSSTPRFIHIAVVSAPLAWTYVAILWNGAAMVNAHSIVARVFANIFIWGILVVGAFFILTFKDYTIGFELAILSLSIAIGQLGTHAIAVQWIFAFVIMGCLIVLTLFISIPGLFGRGKEVRREGAIVSEDRERAPLLEDQ